MQKKFGITLDDIKKKSKKQSANKKYLGWSQSFGGDPAINNAFFNMAMGTSSMGDVSADGSVGAVGTVGESVEKDTQPSKKDIKKHMLGKLPNRSIKMENKDEVKFSIGDGEDFKVSKDKVIDTLTEMLSSDVNFINNSEEEIRSAVRENLDKFIKKCYNKLYTKFYEEYKPMKLTNDVSNDTTDDLTKGMLEGIDSDDPSIDITEYSNPHTSFFTDWDDVDEITLADDDGRYTLLKKKSVLDYDGFYTDYALYVDNLKPDRYVTIFGDTDIYTPDNTEPDATFDSLDTATEWFNSYKGFEDDDFEEDFSKKEPYIPSSDKKINQKPLEAMVDNIDDDYTSAMKDFEDKMMRKHHKSPLKLSDLSEGEMSELDIERQEDENLKDKLTKNIKALIDELKFLKEQAPKEIKKGGAFDSQEEIDDAVASTERELKREEAKLKILNKVIGVGEGMQRNSIRRGKKLYEDNEDVDYEALFKEFMKKSKLFDEDGVYTVYADYRDRLDDKTVAEILTDEDSPIDSFYNLFNDSDDSYDFDYIMSEFDKFLEEKGIDIDYDAGEIGYLFTISPDFDHYLDMTYKCRVVVDTGDGNYDFSLNPSYANDYSGNGEDGDENIIGEPASLVWLAKTQGYSLEQLRKALDGDTQGSKFLESVLEEAQNTTSSLNAIVFLGKASLSELIEQHEKNLPIKISKDATCGLFDAWNGGGSILNIYLEKDVVIPPEYVKTFTPDVRTNGEYSVDDVYGLSNSEYDSKITVG